MVVGLHRGRRGPNGLGLWSAGTTSWSRCPSTWPTRRLKSRGGATRKIRRSTLRRRRRTSSSRPKRDNVCRRKGRKSAARRVPVILRRSARPQTQEATASGRCRLCGTHRCRPKKIHPFPTWLVLLAQTRRGNGRTFP